eukprot:gene13423-biopygen23041
MNLQHPAICKDSFTRALCECDAGDRPGGTGTWRGRGVGCAPNNRKQLNRCQCDYWHCIQEVLVDCRPFILGMFLLLTT